MRAERRMMRRSCSASLMDTRPSGFKTWQRVARKHRLLLPSSMYNPTVPTVDLSCFAQPEEGDKLRSALYTWGLFQAVGHGIPSSLLDELRNISKLFFHLPMQEKQRYFRGGLEGYGNEKFQSEDQILDWHDRLIFTVNPKRDRKMELWPETPSSFRDTLDEYFEKTQDMVHVILKALAKLLDLKEDSFVGPMRQDAQVLARFNFYPPCSRPDLVFGIKPHADGSMVTVILPDPFVEGLQVLNDRLGWVNVPIVHDALLVNVGDQLEIMSNGEYRSPMHRVVTNYERERYSIAMFYLVGLGQEIRAASGLLAKEKGSRGCTRIRMQKNFMNSPSRISTMVMNH